MAYLHTLYQYWILEEYGILFYLVLSGEYQFSNSSSHPSSPYRLQGLIITMKVGFPFAKLLRNFCGTKRKIFLSLRISFARKKNNLRNHSQKSFRPKFTFSTFAKLKFCAIPQLEFCAIPQFRKTQTVGDSVCFLEFNSGKILFWNVFL